MVKFLEASLLNQSITHSINQSTNQTSNQSINQSINQPTKQSINQSIIITVMYARPVFFGPHVAQSLLTNLDPYTLHKQKVVKAAEFDSDYQAKDQATLPGGLVVGDKVALLNRVTIEFEDGNDNDEEGYRKDFGVGHEAFIVDTKRTGKGVWPIIEFVCQHAGQELITTKAINIDKVRKAVLIDDAESKSKLASTKGDKVMKGAEFLGKVPHDVKVEVQAGWEKRLPTVDSDVALTRVKDRANFSLWAVLESLPKYDSKKDFAVITKTSLEGQSNMEVWTLRDFKAGEIMLGPDTNHLMDRMYTMGRSSLLRGADLMHPQKKHMVLDGRMRHKVTELRPFSLFFVVTRAEKDQKSNLDVGFASSKITVDTDLPGPGKRKYHRICSEGADTSDVNRSLNCGIPVMFNPKTIAKDTMLVVKYDEELSKIEQKEKDKVKAEAKKLAREEEAKNKTKAEAKKAKVSAS